MASGAIGEANVRKLSAITPVIGVSLALLFAAGCTSATTSGGGTANSGTSSDVAAATAVIAELNAPMTKWPGPNAALTANPIKGKKIGVVLCGPEVNCARQGNGMAAAIRALGGTPIVFAPATGTVAEVNGAILNMISEGVAGIVNSSWPHSVLGPALQQINAKGLGYATYTADDGYQYDVPYIPGDQGKVLAAYLIQKSGGKAQVIAFNEPEFVNADLMYQGFINELKSCSGCKVLTTSILQQATASTTMPAFISSALAKYPGTQYIFTPYDFTADIAAGAIKQAGKSASVKTVGTGGEPDTITGIKAGTNGQIATVAVPEEWGGWAAVDALARNMNHQPPVANPEPLKLDTVSNLKSTAPWQGDLDFAAQFQKLWGVGQ
jgi:ribose transport system substrate-binding protein